MKSIEISARTVAEAVELALTQLGKDRDEVAIAVLESNESGEEALVRVTVVDDDEVPSPVAEASHQLGASPPAEPKKSPSSSAPLARRILEAILERMDIQAYVTAVIERETSQKGELEESITLHVEGTDEQVTGLLIGRRGDTLLSLQFLVNLIVSRKEQKWSQIVVDVGNYRQRRRESLESLARRIAERVTEGGRAITLEPMAAYERRIVHLALQKDPKVYTQSVGEGENRKVAIYPAKP